MGRLNRPVRVRFRDKIESLLRGQVILSIYREEMYQSNQARDQKENPSLLPAVGEAPRPAFLAPLQP
jgi:hypothetical protein